MCFRAASVNEISVLLVDNGTFSDFSRFGFYRHSLIRLLRIDLYMSCQRLNLVLRNAPNQSVSDITLAVIGNLIDFLTPGATGRVTRFAGNDLQFADSRVRRIRANT